MIVELGLSLLSACVSFYLIKHKDMNPTRASALVSLAGVSVLYLVSQEVVIDFEQLASLVFGASFVGMCCPKIFRNFEIVLGSLAFAMLYTCLVPSLVGLGGALGVSAFVSVAISRGFHGIMDSFLKSKKSA